MHNAEARRNARIKKILENSEQRLRKITGVEEKSTVTELDGIKLGSFSNLENQLESINGLRSESLTEDNAYSGLQQRLTSDHSQTERLREISKPETGSNVLTHEDGINKLQHINELNNSKFKLIHILILAVVQNCIIISMDFLKTNNKVLGNIFLTLIAYDIFHWFSHCNEISIPPFFHLLFSKNTTNYLKYLMLIFEIMQDMMIYFFTFIVIFHCQMILKTFINIF